MTESITAQALAYARHGWPVFPCSAGSKEPATRHGFRDATTDPDKIRWWWRREPAANLAIATGTPGPDVLDVDQHGPAGNGFAALNQLKRAGLLQPVSAIISTPSGGIHAYFTGTSQPNGRLASHHLDFRAAGGYVLAPPSQVGGRHYQVRKHRAETGSLDWRQVVDILEPSRASLSRTGLARQSSLAAGDVTHLAAWMANLAPDSHNRNDGLFWAACRAAEAGDDAALAELATAARTTGLADREITRTIDSARRTAARRPFEHQGGREASA